MSGHDSDKANNDNHANQCNPNNDAYWESRGCDERPDDWQSLVDEEQVEKERRQKED